MERVVLLSKAYNFGDAIKKALELQPNEIIKMVEDSGLKGRGGAGFPTGLKWKLAANNKSAIKYVICNADEGEPGTFKDRLLLLQQLEKLVEGIAIASYAIGTDQGYIYLRTEYRWMLKDLLPKIQTAVSKINQMGLKFSIEIKLNAGAYVCGEETALISSMEGKRGEPRNKPPYPVEKGYLGCPTVINNVETLCYIPFIISEGPDEFRKYGTKSSTGTKLFSISGDCNKPGVYELDLGSSVNEVLKLVDATDTKAVQIGGASGVTVGEKDFDKPIAFEGLAPNGSIIVFNKSRNMLLVLKNLMEFFVEETCGQCTPCRLGSAELMKGVDRLYNGERVPEKDMVALLELAEVMKYSAKCGLGQTTANPFIYIYQNFKDDLYQPFVKN